MQVVSCPAPESQDQRKHDHLWILVGGETSQCDGASAYYIGRDRDNDDDVATTELGKVAQQHDFNMSEAIDALNRYRDLVR